MAFFLFIENTSNESCFHRSTQNDEHEEMQ